MLVRALRLRTCVLLALSIALVVFVVSFRDQVSSSWDDLGLETIYYKNGEKTVASVTLENVVPTDVADKEDTDEKQEEQKEQEEQKNKKNKRNRIRRLGKKKSTDQASDNEGDDAQLENWDPLADKKPEELTDAELTIELKRVKGQASDPYWSHRHEHENNPLYGTPLDNDKKTNPHKAPLPKGYVGKMTNEYKPYEQFRVVKEDYGNPDKMYGLIASIERLEQRFNKRMNYDWVFMNDVPFTKEFIDRTSAMVSGTARYGIIPHEHWSYPDWIDQNRARAVRESRKFANVVYGGSESYRHMCRFNSKFFYKHPIMEDYDLYWRVEPDVEFMCDIQEDPFKYLATTGTMYGFTIAFQEFAVTIETLWGTAMEYFRKESVKSQLPALQTPEDSLLGFVSDDQGGNYNMCHFWTNFEIANLTLWRSPLYEGFADYLDHAGGFFYERWGDAPVHSIAVSMMLKPSQVQVFQDISYKHTVAGTCPLDDDRLKSAHCICDPLGDWTISGQECNKKFLEVSKQPTLKDFKKYDQLLSERRENDELLETRKQQLRREASKRKYRQRTKQREIKNRIAQERKRRLLSSKLDEKKTKRDLAAPTTNSFIAPTSAGSPVRLNARGERLAYLV
ncbi:hypothetical protein HII13_002766 [Brettanomyces bruxellensis]|nr:hypothetical protein HII13_002766 [Brettanomyces bruxellensis]